MLPLHRAAARHRPAGRQPARVALLGVALLLAGVVVSGCSDDDDPSSDASAATASPSATSTAAAPTEEEIAAAAIRVEDGLDQLLMENQAEALKAFEDAAAQDPGNLFAHYNLGLLAQGDDDAEAAIEHYDRALAIQADYAPALYNKAILLETTDLDQAIELYRQVIEADETMAPAYLRLGFALVHQGEEEEGLDLIEQAIELDPKLSRLKAPKYE